MSSKKNAINMHFSTYLEITKDALSVLKLIKSLLFFNTELSNSCNNFAPEMTILPDNVRFLHFSLKLRDILPKKLYSDFSYTTAYLTLIYEVDLVFRPPLLRYV